jgi:hypothetical protein
VFILRGPWAVRRIDEQRSSSSSSYAVRAGCLEPKLKQQAGPASAITLVTACLLLRKGMPKRGGEPGKASRKRKHPAQADATDAKESEEQQRQKSWWLAQQQQQHTMLPLSSALAAGGMYPPHAAYFEHFRHHLKNHQQQQQAVLHLGSPADGSLTPGTHTSSSRKQSTTVTDSTTATSSRRSTSGSAIAGADRGRGGENDLSGKGGKKERGQIFGKSGGGVGDSIGAAGKAQVDDRSSSPLSHVSSLPGGAGSTPTNPDKKLRKRRQKAYVTECPHIEEEHYGLGRCKRCYFRIYMRSYYHKKAHQKKEMKQREKQVQPQWRQQVASARPGTPDEPSSTPAVLVQPWPQADSRPIARRSFQEQAVTARGEQEGYGNFHPHQPYQRGYHVAEQGRLPMCHEDLSGSGFHPNMRFVPSMGMHYQQHLPSEEKFRVPSELRLAMAHGYMQNGPSQLEHGSASRNHVWQLPPLLSQIPPPRPPPAIPAGYSHSLEKNNTSRKE